MKMVEKNENNIQPAFQLELTTCVILFVYPKRSTIILEFTYSAFESFSGPTDF